MTEREEILYSLARALTDAKDLINDLGDTSDMPEDERALFDIIQSVSEYSVKKISEYMGVTYR